MDNFKRFSEDPLNVNLHQVWKTMNKLWPKVGTTKPTAKKNYKGRIISEPNEIKKLLSKEYKERLRDRPIRPDLTHLIGRRKRIFLMKLKLSEANHSCLWTMKNLETALKDLKTNKARDHEGLINEIFKLNVIGDDLKRSLLLMLNNIKQQRMIPMFMNTTNITTVPKSGSRLLLDNERGIFGVSVLRYILMRLIYNDKYPGIDSNMSDCQMGARKKKGCRNNIFIVNGIIHDVMSSKKKNPVLLQIYDYRQMFDAMNLQQALSDIYDNGVKDDNLALLYRANNDVHMAVNTPYGLSERKNIKNVVLQGDTFGSILASVQVDSIGKEVEETGYGYKYKDVLPVSLLGLVDDLIGITDAGYKAQQMNAVLNVKTAEKRLQYGESKCKSMLVSKNANHCVLNSPLMVDKWSVTHVDNPNTGEIDLVETYEGLVPIEETTKKKYLGFIISSKGNNMENINQMKNKSIWIIRKIFKRLDGLNLKKYYFESAMIFLNVMLRSSILYACETYYDLKESELRQLERIEEGFLRRLFRTSKGCPIVQLYLESGHIPARFEIMKTRLLFLKCILQEQPESMIYKFLQLQFEHPTRGDWASTCSKDLKELNIDLSLEEITTISKQKFQRILKSAIRKNALDYLLGKQGTKGSEIKYSNIEMADYLMPNEEDLTIENKRKIFEIRNHMVDIPANFSSSKIFMKCPCGMKENMKHVYQCRILNDEEEVIPFENIYTDNVRDQVIVYNRFKNSLEKRSEIENQKQANNREITSHVIISHDPLSSLSEYSNGNK